jgi:hypothetical protein
MHQTQSSRYLVCFSFEKSAGRRYGQCFLLDKSCRKMYTMHSAVSNGSNCHVAFLKDFVTTCLDDCCCQMVKNNHSGYILPSDLTKNYGKENLMIWQTIKGLNILFAKLFHTSNTSKRMSNNCIEIPLTFGNIACFQKFSFKTYDFIYEKSDMKCRY